MDLPAGFCFAGGFPKIYPRANPYPAGIICALATPNLVLYHWEITSGTG